MNRLGTAFVLALMVMAMSESGDGDMAVADESLSLWDINAAVENAQGAVHAAQKEFNEADAESKAYKTKRWRYLALFVGPEDRDSLAPLGKPPDAERVVAARKKLVDAQRTLTALQLEATERTEARKHRGTGDDPQVHSETWDVSPSLWTGATAAICAATISATTSSHPSRRSVSTAGAVLLASVGLLPVAGAASASLQKPHWDCSSAGTSAVTKHRCPIHTEMEERSKVCSKMSATAVSVCGLHGQGSALCEAVTKPHHTICEDGTSDWTFIQGDLALIQNAARTSLAESPVSVTGSGCSTDEHSCVQTANYPSNYGDNQQCTITVASAGTINVDTFNTETRYDKLTIAGTVYMGSSGPEGLSVSAGDQLSWSSDTSATRAGWKLCFGTAAPTSSPTARACSSTACCWSEKLVGRFIAEQHPGLEHFSSNTGVACCECYTDLDSAKQACEGASDCHGIATQSNLCNGGYRVTHGPKATLQYTSNWEAYSSWAWTLSRDCVSSGGVPEVSADGRISTSSSWVDLNPVPTHPPEANMYGAIDSGPGAGWFPGNNGQTGRTTVTDVGSQPWFKVGFPASVTVATARITNTDHDQADRLNWFSVHVDAQLCADNNIVPLGLTGDIVCANPLTGTVVTVALPFDQSQLMINNIEFYTMREEGSFDCYSESPLKYDKMRPCAASKCSGPGPSQCTACGDEHAFVPWRSNGTEGSCHDYPTLSGDDIIAVDLVDLPGSTSTRALQFASHLTKWGRAKVDYQGQSKSSLGNFPISVGGARCKWRKLVTCQPQLTATAAKTCAVSKSAQLEMSDSVSIATFSRTDAITLSFAAACTACRNAEGNQQNQQDLTCAMTGTYLGLNHGSYQPQTCKNIPAHATSYFLAAADPNVLCGGYLMLL